MSKELSLENLYKDLGYIILGNYVQDFLFSIFPPQDEIDILEPGCGSAKFSLAYALACAYALARCRVVALDIDPEVIDYATRLRGALKALVGGFYCRPLIGLGDIHHLNCADNRFSLVFNEGVPQHWRDEERRQGAINEMARVSKDMVVIIGNNGLNLKEQEIDRTFQFGYSGMPPTRKCFTPDELKERMGKAGLTEIKVEPLDGSWQDATLLAGWGRKKK